METYNPWDVIEYAGDGRKFWGSRLNEKEYEKLYNPRCNPYTQDSALIDSLYSIATRVNTNNPADDTIVKSFLTTHWWPLNLSLVKRTRLPEGYIFPLLSFKDALTTYCANPRPAQSIHGSTTPALFISRQSLNYESNTYNEILYAIHQQLAHHIPFNKHTVETLYKRYPQDVHILSLLAENPTTPVEILEELTWSTHPIIQKNLQANPKLPEIKHIIISLLKTNAS